SAKLRACVPRFFSLSYRVFNLGICIPTLEFDESFLNRYGISQEQSLSSKSSLSPRAPKQVEFSREALGKGAGLPPARASYALEGLLCAVGKEAGLGATLLVDCGVGVLAARGRVTKFTFVQGADSLEVVHREPKPGHTLQNTQPGGNVPGGASGTGTSNSNRNRGGIHAFGKCYIPYTSRGNKELALARARETTSLLRSLQEVQADRFLPPDGVEGEEGMPIDNGVVAAMRAWNPGRSSASSAGTRASGSLAFLGDGNDGDIRSKSGLLGKNATGAAKITAGEIAGSTVRARIGLGRMTLPLRGFRDRGRTPVGMATGESAAATAATVVSPLPPPPLMDVHARLRGSVLSASPSPMARLLAATTAPSPSSPNGDRGIARSVLPERKRSRAAAVEPRTRPTGHRALWLEPTGVERLGSYYSPAAQLLYLDVSRGCLAWRENANTGGFTCNEGGSNSGGVGGGLGLRILAPATPKLARRDAARGQTSPTDSANPQVYVGMVSNVTRAASQGGPIGVNATVVTGTGSSEKDGHELGLRTPHMESECHNRPAYAGGGGGGGGGGGSGLPSSSEARQMSRPHDSSHSSRNDGQEGRSETLMSSSPPDAIAAEAGVQSPELPSEGNNNTVGPLVPESSPGRERTSDRNCPPRAGQEGALAGCEVAHPPRSSSPPVKRNQTPPAVLSKIRRRSDDGTGQRDDDRLPCPGEGRGSMEGERAELWMGQRSDGNGDGGDWAASPGAVQAANPELEVSDAAGRRQAGFARYHHYIQCDSTLAESVTVLQPPWQAGIVRKVIHGLSGRGGGGGGGGGRCNTSSRHSGTPRGWDVEKSNDEEDTSSESDNGGAGVGGIGGGRYSRPGGKDVGGTGTENIPAKDAQEGGEGEEEEGEEGDVFEVHVEGPAPVAKTAQHKVPHLAMTSGGDQPPQSPTTNSGGGRGVVGGGSVFISRVDGAPRATAFNHAANTAKRSRARTPRGVVGPGPGEARMPEVPDGWKSGVEARLEETCEAFRASIRRAVLNYVLLDAGQRDRLGIPAVPPGFASEGWGWGKGRDIHKSPPEWRRRFVRAREALNMGQITGSPALIAAQALLAKCRGTRLLRLPKTAAEIQASSWSAMTAEEFRSSQLSHLSRKARRVRRLLYPGLSEALKAQLGVGSKGTRATTAELATRTKSSPPDGHVRRYLAAVNVMTVSILRGMVETAISDLQTFFRIHAAVDGNNNDDDDDGNDENNNRNGSSDATGVDASLSNRPSPYLAGSGGGDRGRGEACYCPPIFKIFLEDRCSSPNSDRGSTLTCRKSLRDLKEAVMDVVREVVLCFADVPRVVYDCRTAGDQASGGYHLVDPSAPAGVSAAVHESDTCGGAAAGAGIVGNVAGARDTLGPASGASDGNTDHFVNLANGSNNNNTRKHTSTTISARSSIFGVTAPLKRVSLYSEPDSNPSDGLSSCDPTSDDGDEDNSSKSGDDSSGTDSDTDSVGPLRGFRRELTIKLSTLEKGAGSRSGGGGKLTEAIDSAGEPSKLTVLSPSEPMVENAVKEILSVLRKASSEARAACRIYRPFESLLQEAATALAPKTAAEAAGVSEKDLSGLASAWRRYKSTAAVLRTGGDAAPVELPGGIIVVDCQKTSEKLLQVAGDLCKGVLQRVTSTLNKLTSGVTKQARSAILRLGKRPRSTEEMVEAIECLRTMRAEEQIKLRQEQIWMGQLLDFVFEHGGLHHDVIIAVAGVHRVMGELSTATDKAEKAIAEGKAQLQKNVAKAKRRVEGNVDSTKMRIAEFIDSDARPREMSENAASISKELAGLKVQAVDIGEEEAKVDGHTSGTLVASAEKVIVSFQPYADLWSLVGSVGPFITTIMRAPVTTLNPEEITAEHASIKQRLGALIKIMEARSHANPTKAAQESLRLLAALEKDIPILKALTNPRLKDRHWWQISALAGVTVSVEHPTTLQQLNELDVLTDTKADAILRLSDNADAEHALETSTAEVDRFVSEEAVLRISLGKGSGDGEDGAGVETKSRAADGEPEGENGEGPAGAAEEGKQSGVVVERLDEDHLKRILGQVDRWRKVVSDIKLTDAAKVVASTDAAAAAAATEGSEQSEGRASPGVVEALDTALSDLTLVGEGVLKCAELVVDIETELDETTGDEVDREELLKDAVKRWRDFLMAHCGQSLKDLVGDVEKERVHLDEVLDS
ncbi:unnamed protein product, partial [Ectocarpus sp. 8 AP-2014]